jgi:adenine-specific DNA-methyltransferase
MRYDATSAKKMAQMTPGRIVSMPDSDASRLSVNSALEPDRKTALGQFMTPSVIAEFMASLFDGPLRLAVLLDAGAGIGSLTIAAVQKLARVASVDAWEIDPIMRKNLEQNLHLLGVEHTVHGEDFIPSAVQQIALAKGKRYTHAILNPPYKKLNSDSVHRALLRRVGIETVNLYTAFVALSVLLMQRNGEMVAIISAMGHTTGPSGDWFSRRVHWTASTFSSPAPKPSKTMTFYRKT